MQETANAERPQQASPYDAAHRRVHLAMAIGIALLALSGLAFQFRKDLGLDDRKLDIMFVHATIGYGFFVAFVTRIFFGLKGPEPMRFRHVFPRGRDFKRLLASHNDRTRLKFAGRAPLSRVIAGALFILIGANVVTGMTRAGTDLYFPPLGPFVQAYVARDGINPGRLKPGEGEFIEESRYRHIRKAKKPVGTAHNYGAWMIIGIALVHLIGVVSTEWSAPLDRTQRGRARLMLFGPRKAR